MKKVNTKIVGMAVATSLILGCGTVMADSVAPGQIQQEVQAETQADFAASVAIDNNGNTTTSTFYFTPMYDGEYAFSVVDPQFTANSMRASVRVGENNMSSVMSLRAGRTYRITASVTSNRRWVPSWHGGHYVYDAGQGTYGISIRFNAPEIVPEESEAVVVQLESFPYYSWSEHEWVGDYSEISYQYTPEESGEYQVAISDVVSTYDLVDLFNGETEPGEMTPTVSIYNGEDLIFYLEGEGADVTKLDADVTYLVIATADHSGTYTLTIAPAPAVEIHYTEEQLRAMSTNNFVGTLYTRILGRFSDAAGRAEFTDDLLNQGYTATQIAEIMFSSEEFSNLAMDDATFVSCVYYTFCDREATADEAAAMMADLAAGTARSAIVEQMAGSEEWAAFCAYYGVNV